LAVSQTADPTGAWSAVRFAADPNNVDFADFPTLGLDQNAVYLSGDMFDSTGNPIGPNVYSIPKDSLLANPPTTAGMSSFTSLSYTTAGDVLQPAVTTGQASTPELIVAAGDLGVDFKSHSTLVVSTVQNGASTSANLASQPVVVTVPPYAVPINPVQPDGSNNLDDGDARISACARRVGDVLYAVHAVEVNNRAAVRWYRINALNGSLIESGNITDPNLDLFYPSIAANDAGVVVIACNGSSSATYVSSYAVVGEVTDGSLSFGSLTLLQAGTASYQYPDNSGSSRWGDYSATSLDPADSTRFWTIQMIPVGSSTWATQITELITGTGAAPKLILASAGQSLTLSWPSTAAGYQLQTSPVLGPAATWTSVSQTPAVQNNVNLLTLTPSTNQAFYRLLSPSSVGPQN
jgi:hypothetical protein